jgi:hypothetical protein
MNPTWISDITSSLCICEPRGAKKLTNPDDLYKNPRETMTSENMTTMISSIGSINEQGYLKGFKRRGYTAPKCVLELFANSLDSIGQNRTDGLIRFEVEQTHIYMSDNGAGMDREGVVNMFDLHRENHSSESSRGVSGIGAKPSLSILSDEKNMYLFTRKMGGDFLRVDIPWEDIHRMGRYSGMIQVREMTAAEIVDFGMESGTRIVFPYNTPLADVIAGNFQNITDPEAYLTTLMDRISIVFGHDQVRVEYSHYEKANIMVLPLYNYFGGNATDYYTGYSEDMIELWHSPTNKLNPDRFIWDGMEIVRQGKGYAKFPSKMSTNLIGYSKIGEFTLKTGLRKDDSIFNPENPILPTVNSSNIDTYSVDFINPTDDSDFLSLSKIIRNGQTIGLLPIADNKISNARANGEQFFRIKMIQCEVSFNPVSLQDNHQDKLMGIQENKNQFDGTALDQRLKSFSRLVKAIRWKKADQIWGYFKSCIPPAPEPVPAPVPVSAPEPVPAPVPVSAPEPVPAPVPVSAPEPVPVFAPVSAPEPDPVFAPVSAPEPDPVSAPVSAPEPVPVFAPVSAPEPDPVSAPVSAPEPDPVSAPVSAPEPVPVSASVLESEPETVPDVNTNSVEDMLANPVIPKTNTLVSSQPEPTILSVSAHTRNTPKSERDVYIELAELMAVDLEQLMQKASNKTSPDMTSIYKSLTQLKAHILGRNGE